MTDALPLRLNPRANVQLRRIGHEGTPLLVIDDLFGEADNLFAQAAQAPFGAPHAAYYPGLNAPLPEGYLATLMPVLRPSFARAFGISADAPLTASGFLALSVTPLSAMSALQKIPHYDQVAQGALAMVHYLAHDQGGGTGFFRHSASGFESVTPARRSAYLEAMAGELERDSHRLTAFTGPETPNYALIDQVAFRFNRAIIYPSNSLHCALFDGARLSEDPQIGRLTANSFYIPQALPQTRT